MFRQYKFWIVVGGGFLLVGMIFFWNFYFKYNSSIDSVMTPVLYMNRNANVAIQILSLDKKNEKKITESVSQESDAILLDVITTKEDSHIKLKLSTKQWYHCAELYAEAQQSSNAIEINLKSIQRQSGGYVSCFGPRPADFWIDINPQLSGKEYTVIVANQSQRDYYKLIIADGKGQLIPQADNSFSRLENDADREANQKIPV